jgi:RNA polymerase sigma-70 factor (ECF subfamily)
MQEGRGGDGVKESVPARAPVDELVRVENDDPKHDRESDDRHGATVAPVDAHGPVSSAVLSHPGADPPAALNPGAPPRIGGDVTAAADVLPFLRARPTGPHMTRETSDSRGVRDARDARHPRDASDVDDVVSRAAAGEPEAFRTLFLRHKSDVARLVYRMLNAPADLEDVIQEVFVQVFRSLKDFRGQAKFSTWLHRVTVNVVLMHRRSARSRPVLTEELPGELVADDHQTLPDDDVERLERMRAFQRLLARLADKKRIVFVLHELEGMAPAEIAEVVGAPVLTVRTRLFYARRELEAMLAEEPTLAGLAGLTSSSAAPPTAAAAPPPPAPAPPPSSVRPAKGGAS